MNSKFFYPLAGFLLIINISITLTFFHFMKTRVQNGLEKHLKTVLDMTQETAFQWTSKHLQVINHLSKSPSLKSNVRSLMEPGAHPFPKDFHQQIEHELMPSLEQNGYLGYLILSSKAKIITASQKGQIDKRENHLLKAFPVKKLFQKDLKTLPIHFQHDRNPQGQVDKPSLLIFAPISYNNKVIALLAISLSPNEYFQKISNFARYGDTGETYIFDKEAKLLSTSRFEHHLRQIGSISSTETSAFNSTIQDPGGNLLKGYIPTQAPQYWPLTLMATSATKEQSGMDLEGYRDYRGVQVIGTWTWDKRLNYGIATEMDTKEAYQPLRIVQMTVWPLSIILNILILLVFWIWYQDRRKADQLSLLSMELTLAEEKERREISSGLHDSACQNLALAKIYLQDIEETEKINSPSFDKSLNLIDQSISEIRNLVFELSSSVLYQLGFNSAMEELISDISSKNNLNYHFHPIGEGKFSEELEIFLLRATRELLTNIVKHAEATKIEITLEYKTDQIILTVNDNGIGIPDNKKFFPTQRKGFGLYSISQRIRAIGGDLITSNNPHQGLSIKLVSPSEINSS